jgi:hypothetical protein
MVRDEKGSLHGSGLRWASGASSLRRKGNEKTYHSFVRNRLNKRIENLRKSMRANLRPPNRLRIPIHTKVPIITYRLQRRRSIWVLASILHEIGCTFRHIRHCSSDRFIGCFIYIAFDC